MVVEGPDDIVGLLAYALLKQSLREEAAKGVLVKSAFRDPGAHTVSLYRGSAERMLNAFATSAIDEARPEIQESAALNQIATAESNIVSHVTNRTGAGAAIAINLAAWLISLAIAGIILGAAAVNGVADAMLDRIDSAAERAVGDSAAQPTGPSPAQP
jgi:hypothetical protein